MRLTSAEKKFMKRIARRGGRKRALSMSPKERSASASLASRTRWARFRAQQAVEHAEQTIPTRGDRKTAFAGEVESKSLAV